MKRVRGSQIIGRPKLFIEFGNNFAVETSGTPLNTIEQKKGCEMMNCK